MGEKEKRMRRRDREIETSFHPPPPPGLVHLFLPVHKPRAFNVLQPNVSVTYLDDTARRAPATHTTNAAAHTLTHSTQNELSANQLVFGDSHFGYIERNGNVTLI